MSVEVPGGPSDLKMSDLKIPYGISDFPKIVEDGYLYVDRTGFIPQIESLGQALLFVRPRRFGKSLWLSTLKAYYDVATAPRRQELFGDLAIGANPTPSAHRYFVMSWDFSAIDPRGTVEEIGERIHRYVERRIRSFYSDYREHLPEPGRLEGDAQLSLDALLAAIRRTPYKLYLLIDEYDNFANELMVAREAVYQELVHNERPFKQLFKWVKLAMAGQGLDRLFITGVSPLVMSDLTSGLNICRDIHTLRQTNALCGFRPPEVESMLQRVLPALENSQLDPADVLDMMRVWYDGYRFSPDADERVYNPTLTLYFLHFLLDQGRFPRQMLDANLAADEDKLEYLARVPTGRHVLLDALRDGSPLEISHLEERFTLRDLLNPKGQDVAFYASLLFYFGMLTLDGETPFRTLSLTPPNLVVRKLYLDELGRRLLSTEDRRQVDEPVAALIRHGDIEPLLHFAERRLFTVFSNRDYRGHGEQTVKTALATLLFDDVSYQVFSEREVRRGYADLCLLRRPDARQSALWDILLEIKFLKLSELGLDTERLRTMDRRDLEALPPVAAALAEGARQASRYRRDLVAQGLDLRLKTFAVVALGFERLLAVEVSEDG